jgi:hypothetical protein
MQCQSTMCACVWLQLKDQLDKNELLIWACARGLLADVRTPGSSESAQVVDLTLTVCCNLICYSTDGSSTSHS